MQRGQKLSGRITLERYDAQKFMGYMSDLAEMYGRCLSNKGLNMTEECSISISLLYDLKMYKKFIYLLKKSPLPISNNIKNQYPE